MFLLFAFTIVNTPIILPTFSIGGSAQFIYTKGFFIMYFISKIGMHKSNLTEHNANKNVPSKSSSCTVSDDN